MMRCICVLTLVIGLTLHTAVAEEGQQDDPACLDGSCSAGDPMDQSDDTSLLTLKATVSKDETAPVSWRVFKAPPAMDPFSVARKANLFDLISKKDLEEFELSNGILGTFGIENQERLKKDSLWHNGWKGIRMKVNTFKLAKPTAMSWVFKQLVGFGSKVHDTKWGVDWWLKAVPFKNIEFELLGYLNETARFLRYSHGPVPQPSDAFVLQEILNTTMVDGKPKIGDKFLLRATGIGGCGKGFYMNLGVLEVETECVEFLSSSGSEGEDVELVVVDKPAPALLEEAKKEMTEELPSSTSSEEEEERCSVNLGMVNVNMKPTGK